MTIDNKLFRKAKNSPNSLTFREIEKLLKSVGFVSRRGKGNHVNFYHKGYDLMLTIPDNKNPILRIYVKKAMKLIEKILLLEEGKS